MTKIPVPVERNIQRLLSQEDTDGDRRITVLDKGPRRFAVETAGGYYFPVEGTYYLSNLLQELAGAAESGQQVARLDPRYIFENPVDRLSRRIRDDFWDGLTRRIDADGLARLLDDSKAGARRPPRIYVPHDDARALRYFREMAAEGRLPGLEVCRLPKTVTPDYVRSINTRPGILCLALEESPGGGLQGVPFVVPGGRFNELYGWDSYFEALGLLADDRTDLAGAMVDNFCYEIRHYGQILNANRTYYLTRSQPPFLTAMALGVYQKSPAGPERKAWLQGVFQVAIHEYHTVWMNRERLTETGLSRYYGYGLGMPPETEANHYDSVLQPFAAAAGLPPGEFRKRLAAGRIDDARLREYFLHDRAVRESGHDTSYRLENRCAHLNTVDLNSLLYKYEIDIAETIDTVFNGRLTMPGGAVEESGIWRERAVRRREIVNRLLWNPGRGMYFDYDFLKKEQTGYESATAFYPLWAKMCSPEQAELVVGKALPLLEAPGGVLASTEDSRGEISAARPARQWDYPNGWAPHQMLIWQGLQNYGYADEARRLVYRWLDMITRNAADYNGTVPEKYDVVRRSHQVFMEYGNVGTDFAYLTREGFGWMNASYQVGLQLLKSAQRRKLKNVWPAEWVVGPAPVVTAREDK